MTTEPKEKIRWRERLRNLFKLTPIKKEKWRERLHLMAILLGGGTMMCSVNFALLIQVIEGIVVFLFAILIGLLIGLISKEVHYAVLSGLAAPFFGAVIFLLIISGPLQIFVSVQLGNVFILLGFLSVVRGIYFQIFGVLFGSFIGRAIGPSWY